MRCPSPATPWLCSLFMICIAALPVNAFAQAATDQPATATAIRHAELPGGVRLMLDISPVPVFTLFTVGAPDRLIVDFPVVDWQIEADPTDDIPSVDTIRYGLFRQGRSRMVLTLEQPMRVERAFTKPPQGNEPGRLVIDLTATTRAEFDAGAGAPENARWKGSDHRLPDVREGDIVIALDPGHGGIDPGASSGKLREKTVVLAFAIRLKKAIDATPGFTAILTRTGDEFVPLAERVRRAHRAGANVLISIHADSVAAGVADGVSIYTLSEKGTDSAAEALAARENRSDILAGADLFGETDELTRLLVELAQRGTQDESHKLGRALLLTLGRRVELLRTKPMRQASFRVLKAPDIPSILLELGFLDSPKDRARLTDPAWQDLAAEAVVAGLKLWREAASKGFLAPRRRN